MEKRLLVLLVLILVVINISTNCGFNHVNKYVNPKRFGLSTVDSILIYAINSESDSLHYPCKKLGTKQSEQFASKWNHQKHWETRIFSPEYIVYVYFKDHAIKTMMCSGKYIKEGDDYCFDFGSNTYFEKLYESGK
ncbi:hypothetical protein BH09BAC5_BH09BAC5_08280 [soil metagenome]